MAKSVASTILELSERQAELDKRIEHLQSESKELINPWELK